MKRPSENFWLVIFIALLIIIFVLLTQLIETLPVLFMLISVGVITFFGILAVANEFSSSPSLDKGEIRKAIAGSLLIVYIAITSLAFGGNQVNFSDEKLAESVFNNFTRLMEVVVVFYFSSRATEEILKLWIKRNNGDDPVVDPSAVSPTDPDSPNNV